MINVNLTIEGGKKHQRDMIENTVFYCLEKLNIGHRKFDLNIRLKDLSKIDCYGVCGNNHDKKKRREINIDLDKNNTLMQMVKTTCHEMIHCKQYMKKELSEIWDEAEQKWRYFWKGTEWTNQVVASSRDEFDLNNTPWEEEAYEYDLEYAMEVFIYDRL